MLPVLQEAALGDAKLSEVIERLGTKLELSDEDLTALLPSGRQTTFANRIYWAKIHLARAGLLDSAIRGWVRITDAGKTLLDNPPKRIDMKFLHQFPEYVKFRQSDGRRNDRGQEDAGLIRQELTPDETMRAAQKQLESELGQDLLKRILVAPPSFFERLVVKLLTAMGYGGSETNAKQALRRVADGGVDGEIYQDPLGLDRIYIQAKRYSDNSVGAPAIRDFFGALDSFKAAKGLFITTSSFTDSARDTARALSKLIILVDGEQLAGMMIRYGVGCRIEETLHVKKIDEDFFDE